MDTSLTGLEQGALVECEAAIERGLATFVEVGKALLRIRDERLYRATHKTFEEYCRERWNWSRSYAYRQIEAAQVVGNLLPIGNIPVNESQARPLVGLPPETQREVWGAAVESSPNGRVSTRVLERMIREEMAAHGIEEPRREEPRPEVTEEQRRRERNGEDTHRLFTLIHAIEALSEPALPLEAAAREIRDLDTPDKDWCGCAVLAAKNMEYLAKEMNDDPRPDANAKRSNP